MPRIEVVMPQMGESIAEGTIVKWHKKVGDKVQKDEVLLEISTDKVDSEIPSPAAGVLVEIVVEEQKTVPVRTVIAFIESGDGSAAAPAVSAPAAIPAPTPEIAAPAIREEKVSAPAGDRFYSPLVLSIARQEGVSMGELERLSGTGEGGRVTKKDILAFAASRKGKPSVAAPAAMPSGLEPAPTGGPRRAVETIPMTNVQQKMAQHMVQSIKISPHVAAVHEVDMSEVAAHRAAQAEAFERREGFKLTYMPYILEAVVAAIKKFPLINSSIEGDKILRKNAINIGVAVASESGLIVPVIKHADEKNFVGLARALNDLALRTRTKKLVPDDIQDGTFTISNYGVFGTMIGTPIINQPQVAILGTGAIVRRPVVINEAIAIRSMAYFTMSFDHRIVDGALGGRFLNEIVELLQAKRERA
jgi:2-oxoglutarate dehydrogenase complex dihydrolipoamide succinyltransferase (E2) component